MARPNFTRDAFIHMNLQIEGLSLEQAHAVRHNALEFVRSVVKIAPVLGSATMEWGATCSLINDVVECPKD